MQMLKAHLIRQSEAVPEKILDTPITVIGAGAVGSFVTLTLAKMGFGDITVFDFDEVSEENMSSQFYRFSDIGKLKVLALQGLVEDFTKTKITMKYAYVGGVFPGVVISAVDSMGVRRLIWENHKARAMATKVIIDPRMAIESCAIYTVKPMRLDEGESYEKTLHSDADSVQERCTNKATMFCATMLSGLVCKTVRDVLVDSPDRLLSAQWSIKQNDFMGWTGAQK